MYAQVQTQEVMYVGVDVRTKSLCAKFIAVEWEFVILRQQRICLKMSVEIIFTSQQDMIIAIPIQICLIIY